jgi:hypothetical protein
MTTVASRGFLSEVQTTFGELSLLLSSCNWFPSLGSETFGRRVSTCAQSVHQHGRQNVKTDEHLKVVEPLKFRADKFKDFKTITVPD